MMNTLDQQMPRKKALLDELGVVAPAGGLAPSVEPQSAELPAALPSPLADAPAAPAAAGPFKSGNASVSGYLHDAMDAFAPTIRGIADEAGRKKALNDYVTSLAPEVQARGGHISDIHGDGANVDGRRIDFFGDVEGKAIPQYLDVTDEGTAPAATAGALGFGGVDLDSALNGDPLAKIREAIAAMSAGRPNAAALMQQLGGGQ